MSTTVEDIKEMLIIINKNIILCLKISLKYLKLESFFSSKKSEGNLQSIKQPMVWAAYDKV